MNLGNALGLPADVFRYRPDPRLVLPECLLGAEFEFEGVLCEHVKGRAESYTLSSTEPWAAYWKVKHDGSLHDNGAEYLFGRPLFGEDAIQALVGLINFANEKEFKVTIRTGFHLHVDVRDMTRRQLAIHNVLYALFEKAVYRFVGHNRDENVFCLPWYRSDAMSNHVNKINSDFHNLRVASEELAEEKYSGLNLDSLARFGSVEFRHALSSKDLDWVIKWINICLSFKKAAITLDTTPLEVIHNLSVVGPENLARQVFGDLYDTLRYPEFETDVWGTGVETALMVYPEHREIIDAAALSWNQQPEEPVVNPRFLAYVEKNRPEKQTKAEPRFYFDLGVEAPQVQAQPLQIEEVEEEFEDDYDDDDDGDEEDVNF